MRTALPRKFVAAAVTLVLGVAAASFVTVGGVTGAEEGDTAPRPDKLVIEDVGGVTRIAVRDQNGEIFGAGTALAPI